MIWIVVGRGANKERLREVFSDESAAMQAATKMTKESGEMSFVYRRRK